MRLMLTKARNAFPARVLEWQLGAMMFTLGLVFIQEQSTFALSASYVGMARIASEETWGWTCLFMGLIRIVGLFVNGRWVPPTYHIRTICSFLSIFVWFTIVLGLIATNLPTAGLALFPYLLISDCVCLYRTAKDYRNMLMDKRDAGRS